MNKIKINIQKAGIALVIVLCWVLPGNAQVFRVDKPDQQKSPFTGMTREHWKDAGKYLLDGAFSYVSMLDDPLVFPKQPGKSYPREGGHTVTEMLEGLCRTLFIAAPLLKEDPDLTLNGVRLADYYRNQIIRLSDTSSLSYIKPRAKNGGPSQTLVEFGGLAISLMAAPEVLWEPLTDEQKAQLSHLMLSYGDGPTIDMNWRFFNIFILSFYKDQGYTVNEEKLEDMLRKVLNDYAGEGWYNDSPYYDYYSMWAFQMYGVLWADMFGQRHYPDYASQFMRNLSDLTDTYPYMFARDGKMIMWGRSIAYRMGAAAPFPLMGLLENKDVINYGWVRRIASGTLLQFLEHPDFLSERVPTLGFYGAFEPAVQQYSCRGSAFWLGKVFLTGLLMSQDNIFWTAVENEGDWAKDIEQLGLLQRYSEGSNILITDYADIGAAEIRAWCNSKKVGYYEGTENYNKLSYSTAFPWQADGEDGTVSMNYALSADGKKWETLRMCTFQSYSDNVYRRKAVWASDTSLQIKLTDNIRANGVLRVDTLTGANGKTIHFGHYALPELNGKSIQQRQETIGEHQATILDNGLYQLAMVPLAGWDKVEVVKSTGLHPEAGTSYVIQSSANITEQQHIFKALLLWKKSGEQWQEADFD